MSLQSHANFSALQTEFQNLYVSVETKQEEYFATNGVYWQGSLTPSTVNTLDDSKRDLDGAWSTFLGTTNSVWGSYECDSYSGGSEGTGFTFRIKISDGVDVQGKETIYGNAVDREYSDYAQME